MNMWLKRKKTTARNDATCRRKLRYSRYYEHDGALAGICQSRHGAGVPVRADYDAGARLRRLCSPAAADGHSCGRERPGGQWWARQNLPLSVTQGVGSEPTEFEKRAFVRLFLERYLNFSPSNVSRNWAESLNMMTANLRRTAYAGMQKDNLVGKIEDDQTSSEFQLRSLEGAKDDPLTY